MSIASPLFILFSLLAVVLWHGTKNLESHYKMAAINSIFLFSLYSAPNEFLPILTFSCAGYLLIKSLPLFQHIHVIFFVLIYVLIFIFFKQYSFIDGFGDFNFITIGISYVLFRVIHLIVDVKQGHLKEPPNFLDYLNYIFFFLTFVSGPIMRIQEYSANVDRGPVIPDNHEIRVAMNRIILGLVKVLFIAAIANTVIVSIPLNWDLSAISSIGVFSELSGWGRIYSWLQTAMRRYFGWRFVTLLLSPPF